jgi:hypothetical protein
MSISTHSKWNELPAKGYHQNFSARVEQHLYYKLILHNLYSSPAVPNGRSHCTEHTAKNQIKKICRWIAVKSIHWKTKKMVRSFIIDIW